MLIVNPRRLLCIASVVIAYLLLTISISSANDWPSWRGRSQTGVSEEIGLPSSWSQEGENLVWSDNWIGRSTPAVFNQRVCSNGRTGSGISKAETVACWNAETGERLWTHTFSVKNTTVPFNRVGWASVTGDSDTGYLFVLNVDGHLNAFNSNGSIVWSWRLAEELGRASGYGGRTSTPVIDEDSVILSIIGAIWGDHGGPPRHRYISFHKRTGEVQWISTPGGPVFDMNTQSVPIIAVINGRRLLIDGNADGHIYALLARTGEKVWEFNLSKRGINVSPVIDGTTIYAAHSEENIDGIAMGRVVAIDATGTEDVTTTHEIWRLDGLSVGFSSPVVKDGKLYVIDNSANLVAIDVANGNQIWTHSIGTVGKSSPVWADGKLYVTEVNGITQILKPEDDGVSVLDSEELKMLDGRSAEIYGSFAPAYQRLYLTSESGIYCIGQPEITAATSARSQSIINNEIQPGTISSLQIVPAEVIITSGENVNFRVRTFDSNGQSLGTQNATWSLEGLAGSRLSTNGTLSTIANVASQSGKVLASVGSITASAQVRIFGPLPWKESFETGRPPHWIGGGGSLSVVDLEGQQLLQKGPSRTGIHRHALFIGPEVMSNYTVQADAMATEQGRRRPDLGLINSGYTLDLQGNAQRLQIQSWAAELRIDQRTTFNWQPNVWYTLKLRVDIEENEALIRGKVWPRDETEPTEWTITAEDEQPISYGSPGLIAYSPIDVYYDNVQVMEN